MKKQNSKQRLFEVMERLDKTFKLKLDENIFNTPQMGGVLDSNGIAGYNPDTSKQDAEYAASVGKNNPDGNTTNDYFPITTPLGSADDKLFAGIVNQGIDSHLEGFTKSNFSVQVLPKDSPSSKRRIFNFHNSELPILLRRLEELGTEEALQWKDDIENYDNNINEIATTTTVNRKDLGVNPKYTHFAVLKQNNKIINGWDYRGYDSEELKIEKMHYFFNDIKDMQIDPKIVKILTTRTLQRMGIDPFNFDNWNKDNNIFTS
jgi:hypothetical protein